MSPKEKDDDEYEVDESDDADDSDPDENVEVLPVSSRSRRHQKQPEAEETLEQEDNGEACDDYTSQKLKKFVLDNVWNEFIIEIKPQLREISDQLLEGWSKKVGKGKAKKASRSKISCPIAGCSKTFSCLGGIKYHYQRCSLESQVSESKCKLCNHRESLSKRLLPHLVQFHLQELPPVPDDCKIVIRMLQKKIELKNTVSLKPRSKEPRRSASHSTRENPHTSYLKYRKRIQASESFKKNWMSKLMPLKKHWNRCNNYDLFTSQSDSNELTFRYPGSGTRTSQTFDRAIDDEPGKHKTFFIDGPATSSAWAPLPIEDNVVRDQIIAVSACLNYDNTHAFFQDEPEFSVVHMWNVGALSKSFDETLPQLEYSIAISYGIVWDLQWAPHGTSWMPPDEKVASSEYPRLGLLALACSDGEVKIISIPHASSLPKIGKRDRLFFQPTPCIVLHPPGVGAATANQYSICKCISWSVSGEMNLIAAGYGNGIACIWDVSTSSAFYVINSSPETKLISPKFSWFAHKSAISSICFNPDAEASDLTLATSGTLDRQVRRWNVNDLSFCENFFKRSYVTDMVWSYTWANEYLFVAYDDAFINLQQSNATYAIPLTSDLSHNQLSRHFSTVNSISFSDWLNSEASGDIEGHVSLHLSYSGKESKLRERIFRIAPLYRLALYKVEVPKDTDEAMDTNEKNDEDTLAFHTYDGIRSIKGIEIIDIDLTKSDKISTRETNRLIDKANDEQIHPSQYPLLAVNRVEWNPNYSSYKWIFSACQSGLCRVSFVSHPSLVMNSTVDKMQDEIEDAS